MYSIDDSDLRALSADLANAPGVAASKVIGALDASAKRIEAAMRADAAKSKSFRFSGTIGTDREGWERVIGAKKGGAGSLAHIAYFGGANGGGGTVRDPNEALQDEAPAFEKALGDAIEDVL